MLWVWDMRINADKFYQLKTESEVKTVFAQSHFSFIYQVAGKNLSAFSSQTFPKDSFLSSLDNQIANTKLKYSKTFTGPVRKLISKIANFCLIRRFETKLTLAERLKREIETKIVSKVDVEQASKPSPTLQNSDDTGEAKSEASPIKPDVEAETSSLVKEKLSDDEFHNLIQLMAKNPDEAKNIFPSLLEKFDDRSISRVLGFSMYNHGEIFNYFVSILIKQPQHAEILGEFVFNQESGKPSQDLIVLYKKAAEAGSLLAMKRLALFYHSTGCIESPGFVNPMETFRWLKKAAEAGDEEAMYATGYHLARGIERESYSCKVIHEGKEIPKTDIILLQPDLPEAIKWLEKAADIHKNVESMLELGRIYSIDHYTYREALEVDYKKAYEWYLKAAERGNKSAIGQVIRFLKAGQGIPQDLAKAKEWEDKDASLTHTMYFSNPYRTYQIAY